MRLDSAGRVEFLLKEIQQAERTEKELWDFIERLGDGGADDEVGGGVGFRRGR